MAVQIRFHMKTMTQNEFIDEARRRFGGVVRDWKFVCPACGTIQSVQQLLDAVIAAGGKKGRCEWFYRVLL